MIYVMQLWTSILLAILSACFTALTLLECPQGCCIQRTGKQKVTVTGKWKKTHLIQTNIKHREMTTMEKHFVCLYQSVKENYLSLIRLKILIIYHNKNKWILPVHKWQLDHILFSHKFKNIWCTFESQCKCAGSKCFPSNKEMLKFKGNVM